MAGKPPLELTVEVTDANGTGYRWDSSARATDRPTGLSFGTKRGDGFAQGGGNLPRRVDLDHNDLGLYNEAAFIGADGSVAYEGYINATPRSYGPDGHSISVALAGFMNSAKDQKFSEVYVDRDLSAWGAAGRSRQASLVGSNYTQASGPEVMPNAGGSTAIRLQHADKWAAPLKPLNEAWYDAGSEARIGAIWYDIVNVGNASTADGTWDLFVRTTASDTLASTSASSGDIWTSVPLAQYLTDAAGARYAAITFVYEGGAGGADAYQYSVHVRDLAVYGTHGLTRQGTNPGGFYASDVIRDVATRFCPKLDVSGVQDTTYPIPHLVFKRAFPFDAFLECNKYHLWDLGVWENKTLTFRPYDLTDYDWEIRLDDPGVSVEFQGDATEDLANGIVVTYTDVDTGREEVITPDDNSDLADTSIENPANMWGRTVWTEATISSPTTASAAADIGRALLAEFNAPKAPGTYRVTGHIKDRAGHWQQVWKVRAGDTVAITSSTSLSDRPHLIVETQYDHDSYTVTIGVDNTLPRVDAILDRQAVALAAANLT